MFQHQVQVLQKDNHRFKVIVWHRRARKTSTAINEIVKQAHLKKATYWIVFPTYAQAKEAVWKDPNMLFRVLKPELIARKNEVELTLYLHSGSVIALKGGDEPDSLRGGGPYGILFDEFAYMKPEVWDITEPILRANGGWAWFLGTPMGKNHFFDMYNFANEDKTKEWSTSFLKASQSKVFTSEQLEIVKKNVIGRKGEAFYNQEYECEWIEGTQSIFRGMSSILTESPKKPIPGHVYVMGVDLAKHQDYTVIAVYDRKNNKQVWQARFKDIEWPFIKQRIASTSKLYNDALVMLDATGVGDPIADDLLREGIPVEPYKFTINSKKELIEKLSIWVEQKQFRMINDDTTKFEFENFKYEVLPSGLLRYGAPEGYNDDIVIAHGLAVWSLSPLYKTIKEKPKTKIQEQKDKAKKRMRGELYGNEYYENI